MGKYDSSLTRVQPVFNALYSRDRTGESWLSPLLRLGTESGKIPDNAKPLHLVGPPVYELSAQPPKSFLKWLIENPDQLATPPDKYWEELGAKTHEKRRAFLAGDRTVQSEALGELDHCENVPNRAWWRFEGTTKVDCALRTSTAIVFIEGKRTEVGASKDILWYPTRNQVLRNLDCASEYAKNHGLKQFFVMIVLDKELLGENRIRQAEVQNITQSQTVESSLPHMSNEERKELMEHYLGMTTWQDIVQTFELGKEVLPDCV